MSNHANIYIMYLTAGTFNIILRQVSLLGMATGVIIIWLILIVVTLLYTTSIGKICFENIADSQILTFLYDHNPLLEAITRFR